MQSNEAVFRIVYCSRNVIGEMNLDQSAEVAQILKKARKNNTDVGVTGALLYNDEFFAQVLEGPQTSVEKIFERIQQDLRHGEVAVLECTLAGSRDFPEWSMAHVHPLTGEQSAAAASTLHSAMTEPEAAGHDVLQLLRSLVIEPE